MKPEDKVVKINQEQHSDIRDSRLASSPLAFSETNSNSNEIKASETGGHHEESHLSPTSDKVNNDALDHTMLNRFLTFRNPDLEREFFYYFTALNLARWRRTLSGLFITMSIIYIYLITRNSMEWVQWKSNYAPELKTGPLACPTGFFCSDCNPGMLCNEYDPVMDALFWLFTVFLPYAATLFCGYYVQPKTFMNFLDVITVSLVFCFVFLGIGLRYFVLENMRNFFQPTILMMSLLLASCIGMRPRFLYAVILMSLVSGSWMIMNSISLIVNASRGEAAAYSLGFLGMMLISCTISFIGYETEHFYRFQFMTSKEMKKNNAKLTNQLNMLVKTYNAQAGKMLESPLERGMMVIRSVMADPTLSSRHLLALGQVTALLASSNLLIPDFENTAADNMDNEQQAWLFSEIAARKRNKTKGAAANTKRRSGFPTDGKRFLNSSIQEDQSFLNTRNSDESHNLPNGIKISRSSEDSRAVYPPTLEEVSNLLTKCDDYNFNLFQLSDLTGNRSLFVFSHHLFYEGRLFEGFGIPIDKFANFIRTIEKGYRAELPYHNSLHATDVTHCMHTLAHLPKIKDMWSDMELLSMYFAAIIHDHDHPGLTNNFLVATADSKAVLYNDKAVLENHHSASAFKILSLPENNFLSHLSKAEYKSIREVVVDLVLATDLTQHFTLLSIFKSKVASAETFDPYEHREDRMLLFKIMIKCSDVSNPTKDQSIAMPWTKRIMNEFQNQGDMEKKLNIPVSPYMDRDNQNVASCQIGFIDFVVQPLFNALDSFQPIPLHLNSLKKNRDYWGQLKLQGITHIPDVRLNPIEEDQTEDISTRHTILTIKTPKY